MRTERLCGYVGVCVLVQINKPGPVLGVGGVGYPTQKRERNLTIKLTCLFFPKKVPVTRVGDLVNLAMQ